MHIVRRTLTATILGCLAVLIAGPASAGGPTSALLVNPGSGRTASLYISDSAYDGLAKLVGVDGIGGSAGKAIQPPDLADTATGVNVTWLIHDVEVWRVDRIYVTPDGGPWIKTQTMLDSSPDVASSGESWHAAADGPALVALLERMGVFGDRTPVADEEPAVADDLPGQDQLPTAAKEPAATTDDGLFGSAAPWMFLGVGLGVALTVAVSLFRRRLRPLASTAVPGDDVDLAGMAAADPATESADWSRVDELSSGTRR